MRDGAAILASLAAVAVCGGVRECIFAARVGCEAWATRLRMVTRSEKRVLRTPYKL